MHDRRTQRVKLTSFHRKEAEWIHERMEREREFMRESQRRLIDLDLDLVAFAKKLGAPGIFTTKYDADEGSLLVTPIMAAAVA